MADHYAKSLDLLNEVDRINKELDALYTSGAQPRKDVIADLHRQQRSALKGAEIHATLSVRQAIEDHARTGDLHVQVTGSLDEKIRAGVAGVVDPYGLR